MAKFDDESIGIEDLLKTEDDKKSGRRDEISDPLSPIEKAQIEVAKVRSKLRKGMTEEDALKEVKEKENAREDAFGDMSYQDALKIGSESKPEPEEFDTEAYTKQKQNERMLNKGSSDEDLLESLRISPFTTRQSRPYQSDDMYPKREELEKPVAKKTKTEIADTLKKEEAEETTAVTEPTKE